MGLVLHSAVTWWLAVVSLVMFVGSLALIPVIVVRLPADYLVRGMDAGHDLGPDAEARERHAAVDHDAAGTRRAGAGRVEVAAHGAEHQRARRRGVVRRGRHATGRAAEAAPRVRAAR